MGDFNCHHPLWDSRGTSDPCGEEVFDWVISSDLLPLNDPDTPTLLHRSFPDISFAPSSLALPCSWDVLQHLCPDHLPIFLSVPLFRSNERLPSFNFQKARWDDFASRCPSAEEYSSLCLFSAAALFTSLALNAAKSPIPFGRINRRPKAWWKKRLVKDARLLLPLTEVMKITRLTSPLLDAPRQSVPRPKAEAWQTTCSSLSPRSNPKSVHSLLPPFLTVLLPGNRLRFMPLTCDLTFPFLGQRACVAEPAATSLSSDEPRGVSLVLLLFFLSR